MAEMLLPAFKMTITLVQCVSDQFQRSVRKYETIKQIPASEISIRCCCCTVEIIFYLAPPRARQIMDFFARRTRAMTAGQRICSTSTSSVIPVRSL